MLNVLCSMSRSKSSRHALYVKSIPDVCYSGPLFGFHFQMGTELHETSQTIQPQQGDNRL